MSAEPVRDLAAENIASLARDMIETLEDINANGLAAPQVYISKRVVVYRVPQKLIPPDSKMQPIDWAILINPVIEPLTEEKQLIWERCLSIPGLHGQVPRFTKVRLCATGPDGEDIKLTASGFHAMLLQHECDHLDGVLYPSRMTDMSSFSFNTELGENGFVVSHPASEFSEHPA